jgi:hypothetical protein
MNTQKTTRRVITELSACEQQLDAVLFDANDYLTAGGVGAAGLGGAYLYGRKGLKRAPKFTAQDIGSTIGRGIGNVGGDIASGASDLWQNLLKWSTRGAKAVGKAVT